ncbi:MAG: hypothetical protein KF794_04970 [Xanthobacteraceae bacterium]|nr:hypothetical protein [Xanthobacteraceae bacterium]QYK46046.1 MAG: hypothetical protein KF794_04970 [Xanthobacteraceae bacterium]
MDRKRLELALSTMLPANLAGELVEDFMVIRQDFSTKTLGRSAPGKFVETVVQCLQHLAGRTYQVKPAVDEYLNKKVESETKLHDDLRICAGRIARSAYTLRNRRSIAHKGMVDPNFYDLAYLHHAASWIVTEFLRHANKISMQEAGALIAQVQAPIDELIEDIDDVRLVHANVSLEDEVTLLLRSFYPDFVPLASIKKSMVGRNLGTLGNKLRAMVEGKLIFGEPKKGYRLTNAGYAKATEIVRRIRQEAA